VNKVKYKYGDVDTKNSSTLIYLAILGTLVRNIPIASDFTGICEGCNLYLNKYNKEKSKLIIRTVKKMQSFTGFL
jgi:hypothetical protein